MVAGATLDVVAVGRLLGIDLPPRTSVEIRNNRIVFSTSFRDLSRPALTLGVDLGVGICKVTDSYILFEDGGIDVDRSCEPVVVSWRYGRCICSDPEQFSIGLLSHSSFETAMLVFAALKFDANSKYYKEHQAEIISIVSQIYNLPGKKVESPKPRSPSATLPKDEIFAAVTEHAERNHP